MDIKGYYKLLEIDTQASERDIKAAYRNFAKKYHSDGQVVSNALKACKTDKEREALKKEMDKKFSDITAAYEVLSNPEKRQMYDRGIDESQSFGGASGESFFSSFFGGSMGSMFGGERRPQKNNPRVENIHITLLEVILGTKIKRKITRKMVCKPCKATGSMNTQTCTKCRGAGVYAEITNMGGMRLQREMTCNVCMGHGIMKSGPNCKDCAGKGYISKQEELEVSIPPGVVDRFQIVYEKMGDEASGAITGDLIFVVNVKEDKRFTRIAPEHLYTEAKVPLEDILVQRPIRIETIDGRIIYVEYPPIHTCDIGEDFLRLDKEGLPTKKGGKGSLFIRIIPVFVAPEKVKDLGKFLANFTGEEKNPAVQKAVFISKNDIDKWYSKEQQRSEHSGRGHRYAEEESGQTCQTA
ncbi:DnaJ-like protein subfamily A member 2 [Nematocida minor]|uniref:DnaJ-like protein subfamily A member 2 n=1 Tax=Nematocida minor TaxID=1912983 RepID=UPI00221F8A15|nr:DnaJ-like protein subfamily A member 2 [Nematocida minor]XP_051332045.1 DnaJ-like protein subfamily A member 2 [Nematocida minor]KAI5188775.1 DnaJ-like protein subfamily A member 2 [Nematocida minor]KAI5188879.1 DnaJ-like protein subfamily A member 2 [Nematocida minor]